MGMGGNRNATDHSRTSLINKLLNDHSENLKLCNETYESMAKRFKVKDVTLLPYSWAIRIYLSKYPKLECGPMPNLMVALPNIGGALCSMPQSLADAHY